MVWTSWVLVLVLSICAIRIGYLARRLAILERRNAALNSDSARRSELASQVAHEIKNPLTAILCSAQALDLLIGPTLEPVHQRSLRYIKEYGEHLLHIVSDFIDLNRAAGGAIKARFEPIELFPLIESLSGLLAGVAAARKVRLDLQIDRAIILDADTRHIKQVLFNLLHNAIKFSEVGGVVHVRALTDCERASIDVIDHGSGIDAHDLGQIFSPFFTGSHGRDGGLGLGLSVCRALVELNRGTIEVCNAVGGGAHFKVRLPLCAQAAISQNIANLHCPLAGQRFLVVNQDQGVRDSLSCLVTAWGGVVAAAESVEQAASELAKQKFDAVLVESRDREGLQDYLDHGEIALVATDDEQEKLLTRLIESGTGHLQH